MAHTALTRWALESNGRGGGEAGEDSDTASSAVLAKRRVPHDDVARPQRAESSSLRASTVVAPTYMAGCMAGLMDIPVACGGESKPRTKQPPGVPTRPAPTPNKPLHRDRDTNTLSGSGGKSQYGVDTDVGQPLNGQRDVKPVRQRARTPGSVARRSHGWMSPSVPGKQGKLPELDLSALGAVRALPVPLPSASSPGRSDSTSPAVDLREDSFTPLPMATFNPAFTPMSRRGDMRATPLTDRLMDSEDDASEDKRDSHDVTMSTDVHSNPNRVSRPAGVPGLDLTRLAPPFGYMRPQPLEVADTNQAADRGHAQLACMVYESVSPSSLIKVQEWQDQLEARGLAVHPNAALKPWDATPPLARVGSHGSTHAHPTLAASRSGNDVHLALPLPCDDRHVALRRMEAAVAEAAPSWRSRFSGVSAEKLPSEQHGAAAAAASRRSSVPSQPAGKEDKVAPATANAQTSMQESSSQVTPSFAVPRRRRKVERGDGAAGGGEPGGGGKKLGREFGAQAGVERGTVTKSMQTVDMSNSLFFFDHDNGFRCFCVWLVNKNWFEHSVLAAVLAMSAAFAISDPSLPEGVVRRLDMVQEALGIFFVVELCLKVVAYGLILNTGAYLRISKWHVLDFVCVLGSVASWVPGLEGGSTIKLLRAFRVFRPLTMVNKLPRLQLLAQTLGAAVEQMRDIFIVMGVFIIFMATIGLQAFQGKFENRCFELDAAGELGAMALPMRMCSMHKKGLDPTYACSVTQRCGFYGENPNAGVTSFNDLGLASLTVFQAITAEGWVEIEYFLMDSTGHYTATIYMLTVMVFGSLLLMNVTLAVVFTCYNEQKDVILERHLAQIHLAIEEEQEREREKIEQAKQIRSISDMMDNFALVKEMTNDAAAHAAMLAQEKLSGAAKKLLGLQPVHKTKSKASKMSEMRAIEDKLKRELSHSKTNTGSAFAKEKQGSPLESRQHSGLMDPGGSLSSSTLERQSSSTVLGLEDPSSMLTARTDAETPRAVSEDGGGGGGSALQTRLRELVESDRWCNFFLAIVVYNSLTMTIYHHGINPTLMSFLDYNDITVCLLFTVEFGFKVFALGAREYFGDASNQFDFFLVLCGLVEIYDFIMGGETASGMQVLRASRAFRVFKLAKRWDALQTFINSFVKAAMSLGPFMCLVTMLVFVAALLGRALFAGLMEQRLNYDTLFWATVTTFQLLSGENWNDTMYSAVAGSGLSSVFYFFVVYTVGNLVIVNLIIAVLIDNCQDDHVEKEEEEEMTDAERAEKEEQHEAALSAVRDLPCTEALASQFPHLVGKAVDTFLNDRFLTTDEVAILGKDRPEPDPYVPHVMVGLSLGGFHPEHPLRVRCHELVESSRFKYVMMAAVLASSLMLPVRQGATTPPDPFSVLRVYPPESVLETVLDVLFMLIFWAEIFLKWIVMGVWKQPHAYFKDASNWLDFAIAAASLIGLPFPRMFLARFFRALRPLRIVTKVQRLKMIITSLTKAMAKAMPVVTVGALLISIFSVLGVQLFAGRLNMCSNEAVLTRAQCVGDWVNADGLTARMQWKRAMGNGKTGGFDNYLQGILTVFEICTLEMWPNLMIAAVDSQNEVDLGPKRNAREWVVVYFMTCVVVLSIFFVNFFVGIVVDTWHGISGSDPADAYRPVLREYHYTLKTIFRKHPAPILHVRKERRLPSPGLGLLKATSHQWLLHVVSHERFDSFFMWLSISNAVALMTQYYGATLEHDELIEQFFILSTALFAVEAGAKVTAFGFKLYSVSAWNSFDLVVLVLTALPYMVPALAKVQVLRILRLVRGVHVMRKMSGVGVIIEALNQGMSQTMAVLCTMTVLIYSYSLIGMSLFGQIADDTDPDTYQFLGAHANFHTFGNAINLLIRCASGESYNGVMHEMHSCDSGGERCRWSRMAYPFLVSFVFVIQLILVNLVVAVILESYTEASDSQRRLVSSLTLQNFTDQWQLRDPDATGFIRMEKLGKLFKSVPPPLAFRGTEQAVSFGKLMPLVQSMELNIYMSSNKAGVSQYYVSFHELLMKLSARAMCARTTDKTAVHAIKQSVRLRTQQEIDKHAFKLRVIRSFREMRPEGSNGGAEQLLQFAKVMHTVVIDVASNLNVGVMQVTGVLRAMSGTSVNKRLPVGTHPEFLAHEWLAVRVLENFYLRHRLRKNAAMDPTLKERVERLSLAADKAKAQGKGSFVGRLSRRFMQGPRAQYDDEVDAMDDPISDSDEDEHFGGKAVSFLKRQFSRAPSPPKREREVEMHRREMRREVSREAPLVPGVEPGYRAAINAKHTLDAFGAKAPPPPATEARTKGDRARGGVSAVVSTSPVHGAEKPRGAVGAVSAAVEEAVHSVSKLVNPSSDRLSYTDSMGNQWKSHNDVQGSPSQHRRR